MQAWALLFHEMITTVDEKGKVPLPIAVMRASDVHPGDELQVSAEECAIVLRKAAPVISESLLEVLRGLKGLPIPDRGRNPVASSSYEVFGGHQCPVCFGVSPRYLQFFIERGKMA